MYNELNKHKKSDSIKWVTVFVAIVLLFVGVVAALIPLYRDVGEENSKSEKVETEAAMEESFAIQMISSEGIRLASGPMMAVNSIGGVSKTLTATISPDDAVDKNVDWSIAWEEGSTRAGEPVTDYITVTPESDGALVATVTCFKAFSGDKAIITVITRAGGFTATCAVEFKGIPSSLSIDTTGYTSSLDSTWGVQMVDVLCGEIALFDLDLDNVFGSVGSEYGDYAISLEAHGAIDIGIESYDSSGNHTGSSTITYDLKVADLFEQEGYSYTFFDKSGGMHSHVRASIEGGKLRIDAQDAISAYFTITGGRTGRAEYSFKNYVDGKVPYVTVTVTERVSGLSQSVNIRTIATVENIALSSTNLIF